MKKMDVRKLTTIGMLCAVSYVMVLIGRFIPNVAGFLSYDPKDAIVVFSGFVFGPFAALILSVVVSFIEMFTISTTGIYGCLMNIFSTCSFALPAALIYKRMRTVKGAVLGLGVGVVCMTGCMVLWNYMITPLYMKVDRSVVVGMLLPVFLPFNFVKGGLNAGLTMLLYKPLTTALRSVRLLPKGDGGAKKGSVQLGITLAALFVVATFTVLFLIFADII